MNPAMINLFKESESIKKIATIDSIISLGWYLVQDQSLNKFRVESDLTWNVGDVIAIQFGRIVGRAVAQKTIKVYEV